MKDRRERKKFKAIICLITALTLIVPLPCFGIDDVQEEQNPAATEEVIDSQANNSPDPAEGSGSDRTIEENEPSGSSDSGENVEPGNDDSVSGSGDNGALGSDDAAVSDPENNNPEDPAVTEGTDENDGGDGGDTPDEGDEEVFPMPDRRFFSSFTVGSPVRMRTAGGSYFNLRKYAGETHTGYSISQGSCTDGTYSYHMLINTGNEWGRLVKVRISDGACIAVSNPFFFNHGNGMCFDTKRNRVVITCRTELVRTLTFVNPDNLNDITQDTIKYGTFKAMLTEAGLSNILGLNGISYNAKYDCYVGMQKQARNVVVIDPDSLEIKAVAATMLDSSAEGTLQDMDSDDTYAYFLVSKTNGTGKIIVFDWHAEKLAALLNGTSTEEIWWCGNGDGYKSAVITVKNVNEIESMYHVDVGNGKGHFYLTNYSTDPKYKTIKVKVKWKKVKKRVKVKWKRVKKKVKWKRVKTKSGKWKWKYKTKKVWKYKYKTKKVWKYKKKKKRVFDYYNRDNYIIDLGVF